MSEPTFLIAIDGSPASDAAIGIGLDLAVARGASVAFFHASGEPAERLTEADEPGSWAEEGLTYADELIRQAVASAETRGVRAAGEVFGRSQHPEPIVGIAEAIVRAASGYDAELIVLGSRGRSTLADGPLGSVSHGVLRSSPVPVVVCRA